MSTSVIRCPGCGAADTSTAGPGGVHTCVYCGVRYQVNQGTPRTIVAAGGAATPSSSRALLIGVLALIGVVVAAAMVLVTRPAESPPPRASSAVGPSTSRTKEAILPATPRSLPAPAENKTVSVAPPAEETAPATAEFTLESTRRAGDALWIYGFFHNTSPFTLGKTKITAVFYDKDGKEVATDSGFTEDDVIAADARVPAVLLASDAPATYDRVAFEVHAERPSYLPTELSGLDLEADPPRKDGFLGWKFAGKVHNKSGQPARFVKVGVVAFDEDDKFAGHAYTYVSGDVLAADASGRFDGSLLDSKTSFKRFEFRVSGRPAQ